MANKFLTNIELDGDLIDINGNSGTAGQVLSSLGSGNGVDWIDIASDTAERIEVTVKNVSGGSLSKGTVVHASPSGTPPSGNVIEVIAADYDDSTKMPAIGILNETIADEGEGSAVMMGAVSGIDTSSFSTGDELYVGNLGTLTNTKPATAGQLIQKIAVVIKSHASNGLIKIFGAGRSNDVPLPLYIDNTNQRVGIGDSTPSYTLDVNGTIYGSTVRSGRYYGTSGTSSYLDLDSGATYSLLASSEISVTDTITCNDLTATEPGGIAATNGPVYANRFYGNGNTTYFVDPNDSTTSAILNGKVGIGTTSPSTPLEVNVTGNNTVFSLTRDTGTNGELTVDFDGANANFNSLQGGHTFQTGGTERLRIDSSGNVGIGTSSPSEKLDVSGTIQSSANEGKLVLNSTATNGKEYQLISIDSGNLGLFDGTAYRLWVAGSGNVGINTTSPTAKTDIRTSASSGATNAPTFRAFGYDTDSYFEVNNNANNSANIKLTRSDAATMFSIDGHSGTTFFEGNVGIGTASPDHKLHLEESDTTSVFLKTENTAGALLVGNNSSGNSFVSSQTSGKDLLFETANTERLRIGSSGQIGIGGANYGTSGQVLTSNGSGSAPSWQNAGAASSNWTLSGNDIYNNNSGNVGIGTSSPDQKLHVHKASAGTVSSNSNAIITAENNANGYIHLLVPDSRESGVLFGNPSSSVNGAIIYNNSGTSNGLQFRTSGNSTKMVINSSGNVGINTTSPAEKLQVVGNIGVGNGTYNGGVYANSSSTAVDTNWGLDFLKTTGQNDYSTRLKYYPTTGEARKGGIWNSRNNAWVLYGDSNNTPNVIIPSGNVGINTTSPSHKLEVNGTAKADEFVSLVNTSNSGITRDWTRIGTGDRGAGLEVGDISGARYAIYAGGYDLTFGKHVSSNNTYTTAMAIYGADATDSSPYVQAAHSFRAPIFYDSNDTGYYVNPASTSQIRKTNLIASGSGWDDGLNLYSSDASNRWNLLVDNGAADAFRIAYNNSDRLYFYTSGEAVFSGSVTGSSFVKSGGTSSQFLKADGSVDSSTYLTSLNFSDLSNKESGTGTYSTSGFLEAGRGNGGVALTHNDSYGNANVTFNHRSGTPEQAGSSGRIVVTTDSTTAKMTFELKDNVSSGTAVNTPSVMELNTSGAYILGTLDLGNSTDTTLSRHSAGNISIQSNRVFHDGYHPNADKWTTSRTLTLSGDVTGSVTFDGSGDIDMTNTAVANDSHNHDGRYYTETESDSRFVNVTGDTMSGTLVVGGGNGIGDGKMAVRGGDLLLDRGKELRWNTGSGSGEYIYSKTSSPYDVTIHSGSYDALQAPNTGEVRINYQGSQKFVTTSSGVSITGNIAVSGTVDGVDIAAFKSAYDNHDHDSDYVNVTGDTINGDLTVTGGGTGILVDTSTHASVRLDRASTSYDNNLLFYTAGSLKWRLWQDGSDDYLYVRNESGSNNLMTFRSNNTVGINTGTPNATLHLQIPGAAAPSIFLQAATNFAPGIYFDDSNTGTSAAGAITYATANNTFSIKANSTSVVTISSGTTTIAATADIVAYSSDKRLKENVQPIEKPLNKVLKLEGVTYNWNKKAEDVAGFDTEIKEVGLFAQDVQKVLPEAVKLAPFDTGEDFKSKSGEDYLTVQYEKIVPLLVEAIKDQQKQIDELKSIINGGS